MKKVVITAAKRTPIGSFMGVLSSIPAPKLRQYSNAGFSRYKRTLDAES
jgi:acetyl-CoA acetyltransferase